MHAVHSPWACCALLPLLLIDGTGVAFSAPQPARDLGSPKEAALPAGAPAEDSAVQDEAMRSSVLGAVSRLPLAFVENRGQLDDRVTFATRQGGLQAFFTEAAIVLQLVSQAPSPRPAPAPMATPEGEDGTAGACVFLVFEGASPEVAVKGCDPLPGRYNYLLGGDPSKWRTNVPAYASIRYRGLYPGVDMVVRDHDSRLEYDLILAPGGNLDLIAVRCEGNESLHLGDDGVLMIETAAGPVEQSKPLAYQADRGRFESPLWDLPRGGEVGTRALRLPWTLRARRWQRATRDLTSPRPREPTTRCTRPVSGGTPSS
ncbi:MAG: hypothetical protein AB1486_00910 [Planctomycetota bacterium]